MYFVSRFLTQSVAAIAALLAATAAAATPGDLDKSFGANGVVTDPFGSGFSEGFAVAVQPDGKIVMAGEHNNKIALVRYNADGTLDDQFNASSSTPGQYTLSTPIGSAVTSAAYAVTTTDGGAILIAGETESTKRNFTVARLTSDGTLDTDNFNSGSSQSPGANVLQIGTGDSVAKAIAVQTDGKIIAAGSVINGSIQEFVLARYTSAGDLDTASFNIGGSTPGVVMTPVDSIISTAQALVIQSDGKIVAAGSSSGGPHAKVAMVRYNANGAPDGTFGTNAVVTTDIGTTDSFAYGATLQPDGKIVIAGQASNGTVRGFALARYDTDGSLDNSFGNGGTVITPIGSGDARAQAVALQPDGKIVAAGFATDASGGQVVAIARYDGNGVLDAAFNPGGTPAGTVTTAIGTSCSLGKTCAMAQALALQTDAKVVAVGSAYSNTVSVAATARYIAADTPWSLTPDQFQFNDVQRAVLPNTVQTSNMITIAGLGQGIQVPVTVSDGEYAKNGSSAYTVNLGWAKNGDQFNVRHAASPGTVDTRLSVGGMVAADNPKIVLGNTTSDAFSSLTITVSSSGTGAIAALSLLIMTLSWLIHKYRGRFPPRNIPR